MSMSEKPARGCIGCMCICVLRSWLVPTPACHGCGNGSATRWSAGVSSPQNP